MVEEGSGRQAGVAATSQPGSAQPWAMMPLVGQYREVRVIVPYARVHGSYRLPRAAVQWAGTVWRFQGRAAGRPGPRGAGLLT